MTKQTTLQIGSLIVLALIAAGLLWKLPPQVDRLPAKRDVVYADPYLDDLFDGVPEDALTLNDRVIQMYIDEDFPTVEELSPDLRELMITLFMQTDAFRVIDQKQFGASDEWATIVSAVAEDSIDSLEPRVCGIAGSPLCILFYQNGERGVEIYDIYQAFDQSKESYYEYSPEILEILSLPHAGDVLVGGYIPFAMGKDTMRYDVATLEGRTNVINVIMREGGYDVVSESANLSFAVESEWISTGPDGIGYPRVTIKDAYTTLLAADGEPGRYIGPLLTGFDPKSTYSHSEIYFSLFGKDYSYGRFLDNQGKTIYLLDEIE